MKKLLFSVAILITMVSCVSKSSYTELENKTIALQAAQSKIQADYEETLTILNEVEDGFKQIKDSENYLNIQSTAAGEVTQTDREKIITDVQLIAETLRNNKIQIEKLKQRVANNGSDELKKTINRLSDQIEAKSHVIANLQEQLAKKDVTIAELNAANQQLNANVSQLNKNVSQLATDNEEKNSTIEKQKNQINAVYYIVAKRDELKKLGLIESGFLKKTTANVERFNNDLFQVGNKEQLNEISLYCKKANFITEKPKGSYELIKDNKGLLTLSIKNPALFWAESRYLIIESK